MKARIRSFGPISVADYMTACLHDAEDGYYATRPALGEDGDFITAPLVSQMFGELLGLWAVETWRGLGRPARLLLVEAGPGNGVLMQDLLRAARLDPAFLAAAELWLVETSAPLRAAQAERLAGSPLAPRWTDSIEALPHGPAMILIANELLDCLPARQFVRVAGGWAERRVGLGPDGELAFGLAPCPDEPALQALVRPEAVPDGAVVEISAPQAALGSLLGARLTAQGGAVLLIDYGRDRFEPGDTFQALHRHRKADPLAAPGQADLTVHADFPAVLAAAQAQGAGAAILPQGEFLRRLGIEARAAVLARARPDHAPVITRQLARLIASDQMGVLFKAACLFGADGLVPPGFDAPGGAP
ncbi:MAG: SAM-dependent methyltransferase [Caulobacteraceae bacterium]|nr:SAM-dependent methyltransferase [Caulobacteraceae bacterium]